VDVFRECLWCLAYIELGIAKTEVCDCNNKQIGINKAVIITKKIS